MIEFKLPQNPTNSPFQTRIASRVCLDPIRVKFYGGLFESFFFIIPFNIEAMQIATISIFFKNDFRLIICNRNLLFWYSFYKFNQLI